MRRLLILALLIFGLAAISSPVLVAGSSGSVVTIAGSDDYDTGGG